MEGSTPLGGVMCAVICWVWPEWTVSDVSLNLMVAAAVDNGTGPSAGNDVPYEGSEKLERFVGMAYRSQ